MKVLRALYRKLTSARSKSLSNFRDLEKKFKKESISYWWWRIRHGDYFVESETTIRLDVYQGWKIVCLQMLMQFHLQMMSLI